MWEAVVLQNTGCGKGLNWCWFNQVGDRHQAARLQQAPVYTHSFSSRDPAQRAPVTTGLAAPGAGVLAGQ